MEIWFWILVMVVDLSESPRWFYTGVSCFFAAFFTALVKSVLIPIPSLLQQNFMRTTAGRFPASASIGRCMGWVDFFVSSPG
jgi:hypothetical protein